MPHWNIDEDKLRDGIWWLQENWIGLVMVLGASSLVLWFWLSPKPLPAPFGPEPTEAERQRIGVWHSFDMSRRMRLTWENGKRYARLHDAKKNLLQKGTWELQQRGKLLVMTGEGNRVLRYIGTLPLADVSEARILAPTHDPKLSEIWIEETFYEPEYDDDGSDPY